MWLQKWTSQWRPKLWNFTLFTNNRSDLLTTTTTTTTTREPTKQGTFWTSRYAIHSLGWGKDWGWESVACDFKNVLFTSTICQIITFGNSQYFFFTNFAIISEHVRAIAIPSTWMIWKQDLEREMSCGSQNGLVLLSLPSVNPVLQSFWDSATLFSFPLADIWHLLQNFSTRMMGKSYPWSLRVWKGQYNFILYKQPHTKN